jgi:hypothetical protein
VVEPFDDDAEAKVPVMRVAQSPLRCDSCGGYYNVLCRVMPKGYVVAVDVDAAVTRLTMFMFMLVLVSTLTMREVVCTLLLLLGWR